MVMTILISLRRRALQKRYRKNQKYLYIQFYFTKLCIMIEANNILDFKLDLIENLFTT